MRGLNHVNVVKYLDHFTTTGGRTVIVMEYCDSGTLEDYMFDCPRPHPEDNVWKFTWQISGALTYLHQLQIIHQDLKPSNLLCKSNAEGTVDLKIADFGVCNILDSEARDYAYNVKLRIVRKECYLAPEALRNRNNVDTSLDIWSLGAVISYVANDAEHLFKSSSEVLDWRGEESPVRAIYSKELRDLVLSALNPVMVRRPTAAIISNISERNQ